ncbi:MAG TPA: hypothetical protein VN851_21600 [Thermoanaerobaculia bacterium]|nr:hypothetical protein [Thermoanaerobaculia bacterium]
MSDWLLVLIFAWQMSESLLALSLIVALALAAMALGFAAFVLRGVLWRWSFRGAGLRVENRVEAENSSSSHEQHGIEIDQDVSDHREADR